MRDYGKDLDLIEAKLQVLDKIEGI